MATATPSMQMPAGSVGQKAQEFSELVKAKHMELTETGQIVPFTVINFNPVPLTLEGMLARYRVPSPDDDRLPKDVSRITLSWAGKERVGHALTMREPHMYGRMMNATPYNGDKSIAVPDRAVEYILPVGIAFTFLEHFSPIFVTGVDKTAPAPPKDGRRIYGVLAFKGDLRTLAAQSELLEEELQAEKDGIAYTGPRATIEVPLARLINVGNQKRRAYSVVQFPLRDYLRQMFDGQVRFASVVVSRAQQKFSETETVKDISESDRVWMRWLIKMGYAQPPKSGERHWLNEVVDLGIALDSSLENESPKRKCPACKRTEPEFGTPFCQCGAPMDVFKTYMDGFPVPDSWLETLRGEQRQEMLKEKARRRSGMDTEEFDEDPAPVTEAPADGKPMTRAQKRAAAKAAKAAAATASTLDETLPDDEV
jgi:hypothetical protein